MISSSYNMNTPSFGAKFINKKDLLRLNFINKYEACEKSIVELNHSCPEDSKAIEALHYYWPGAKYLDPILAKHHPDSRKIYAVTTQDDDFKTLNPEKILGIADLHVQDDSAYLKFLQANPKIIEDSDRPYKHIGQALLYGIVDYLKENNFSFLKINSTRDKKPMYRKLFPNIVEKSADEICFYNMVVDLKNNVPRISVPTNTFHPSNNIQYFG